MKFADDLSQPDIQKFNQLRKADRNKPITKKKEKLSRRDLEELMGTRRDTYERHNGAWRTK